MTDSAQGIAFVSTFLALVDAQRPVNLIIELRLRNLCNRES
jgi:hypothetical protein